MLVYFITSHYAPDVRPYVVTNEKDKEKLLRILNQSAYDFRVQVFDTEDDFQKFLLSGGKNYFVAADRDRNPEFADFDPSGEEPIHYVDGQYTMTVRADSEKEAMEKAKNLLAEYHIKEADHPGTQNPQASGSSS